MPTDHDAFGHPSYDDAVRTACKKARENPGDCFTVYYDGTSIYVRPSGAPPPKNAKVICIAQVWDDKTAQLRFDGGRSEWINV